MVDDALPARRIGGATFSVSAAADSYRRNSEVAKLLRGYMDHTCALSKEEFWNTATVEDVVPAIEGGADVHAGDEEFEVTPLHYAASSNDNPEAVEPLLTEGAEIMAPDADGATPLHYTARFSENPEVKGLLLAEGAEIMARDKGEATPPQYAASSNDNPEVAGLLPDRGAELMYATTARLRPCIG